MNGTFLHQALLGTLNSARRLIGSGSVRPADYELLTSFRLLLYTEFVLVE